MIIMAEKVDYDILNESYKGIAEVIGVEAMLKIRDNYCGMQLQLPMRLYDANKLRKKLQTMDVQSNQVMMLSRKYGYSPRWIKEASK
ncbi:hypothetical protein LKI01_19940 [Companilactobacillus paralimentarius]|uniref:Mor transcription activator domain-containing protein n=2 Tax=Companilactobacillus kimchii TaxID=2801452 RepID=A0A210PB97_9LACO|nr:hypothetical protein LKACC12383_00884 [Companilactobacillus kimchii]GEO47995.1 hypothetical protein LKI01_19940 [Companilactobacillus paralimentarius]